MKKIFTILDEPKDSLTTRPGRLSLVPYLKARNSQGCHIFVRPIEGREAFYLLCDDLDQARLERQHKVDGKFRAGRLIVESSPANFQVWIKSDRPLDDAEKRYWLKKFGSDPGATPRGRWGRMPGFRNRKPQYKTADGWSLSKSIWRRFEAVEIPRIDVSNSISSVSRASVSKDKTINNSVNVKGSDFYRYRKSDGSFDESSTDFAFVLTLLRFGIPDEQIKELLIDQREDWRKHRKRDEYIQRTIQRARTEIEKS